MDSNLGPQAQMELIRLREEEEHMVLDLSVYQSTNSQQVVHGRWHSRPCKCSRRTSKWYRTKRKKKKVDLQMFRIPVVNSSASSNAMKMQLHVWDIWEIYEHFKLQAILGRGFQYWLWCSQGRCFVLSQRSAQRQRVEGRRVASRNFQQLSHGCCQGWP